MSYFCSEEELQDREKKDTYEEKGVAEEHGLRKLIDSEDESEEEEDKKSDKEEEEGEGDGKDKKEKKKKGELLYLQVDIRSYIVGRKGGQIRRRGEQE